MLFVKSQFSLDKSLFSLFCLFKSILSSMVSTHCGTFAISDWLPLQQQPRCGSSFRGPGSLPWNMGLEWAENWYVSLYDYKDIMES
jgi:hypothetical protein